MRLKLSSREEIETDDLTTDELIHLRDRLTDQVHAMDVQIQDARRKVATQGEYSDPLWFQRVLLAKRKAGQVVQKLMPLIAQRQREARRAANPPLSEIFMAVCRERLADSLFETIFQEAKARSMQGRAEKVAQLE